MSSAKIALVTGAGTGIGKCVANTLQENGWTVLYIGRRLALLEGAVLSNVDAPGEAISCDVADEDQVNKLFAHIQDKYGRIDLLFNNAGVGHKSCMIDELSVERWRQIVDINLTGSFLCARAAFAMMRRQEPQGGRIINNGSISAHAPRPGSVAYTSTKHAITGLTRTLALDGRAFNIACGQIDIGNALTDMVVPMTEGGVPQANGDIATEPSMDVQVVGDSVLHMANLPLSANSLFMNVMATNMPFVGRG